MTTSAPIDCTSEITVRFRNPPGWRVAVYKALTAVKTASATSIRADSLNFLLAKRNRFGRTLLAALRDPRAAIDLASIMVGVLVIGIIGGVIAVAVFAVIPWAQDEAAKGNLGSIRTAESVAAVQQERFVDVAGLQSESLIPDDLAGVNVGTDAEGTCYTAVSRSDSGNIFYLESTSPATKKYTLGESTPGCVDVGALSASRAS
jgi:type II secretory pathway pseudopilin PulG